MHNREKLASMGHCFTRRKGRQPRLVTRIGHDLISEVRLIGIRAVVEESAQAEVSNVDAGKRGVGALEAL